MTERKNQDEETRSTATRKSSAKMVKFRVRPGHTVTTGTGELDNNDRAITREYKAGEEVELTQEQADQIPHAVESGERRKHTGQTARLQRKISDLERQMKEQEELLKAAGKKDPELQRAIDSIKKRGDNYIARAEPDPWAADAPTIAAFDGGIGDDAIPQGLTDEEIGGGMKGVAREHGGAGTTGRGVTQDNRGAASQPSRQPSPNTETGGDEADQNK